MSRTILVVDDDVTLVAPLKDGLESAGYRVAVAFDSVQRKRATPKRGMPHSRKARREDSAQRWAGV